MRGDVAQYSTAQAAISALLIMRQPLLVLEPCT